MKKPTILLPPYMNRKIVPDVFLAGPIQGSDDWQSMFIESAKESNLIIANPRRPIMKDFVFENQVMWETYYLNASKSIFFWLAKETEHKCERAYAQTTRFELGEWMTKSNSPQHPKKIFIGVEHGFTGFRYIKTRLQQEIDGKIEFPNVHIVNNFQEIIELLK